MQPPCLGSVSKIRRSESATNCQQSGINISLWLCSQCTKNRKRAQSGPTWLHFQRIILVKIRLFLLLSGFLFSGLAMAENGCPYGESPIGGRSAGNPLGCVPNPQAQELRATPAQPAPPRGHWETRWGAIAIDGVKGKLGGSN